MSKVKKIAKKLSAHLYFWVIVGMVMGGALGAFLPAMAMNFKPVTDSFITVIKFLVMPIIFCTIVTGISGAKELKRAGRVAAKVFIYFEVVSTFALVVGLVVGNILRPGEGLSVGNVGSSFAVPATVLSTAPAILNENILIHLLRTNLIIDVLLLAIVCGVILNRMPLGEKTLRQNIQKKVDHTAEFLFLAMNMIMKFAPIAAGAAIAVTVSKHGLAALQPLLWLVVCFYVTCILFWFCVLGSITKMIGVNIFKFTRYLGDELVTVLGTSSSESALAPLMKKLENYGCSKEVVGITVPAGYSFNLDGTNIYMTLTILFMAQASGVHLSLERQFAILLVSMITSKGASGVTGAGFIALSATVAATPEIPIAALGLVVGVDRFMSEARAVTNFMGNAVATLVISKWEGESLNVARFK